MGSFAYGVSSDTSDCDVYGWAIPSKEIVFPHLTGEVHGFGKQKKRFEQWQEHHVMDESALGGKGREYDLHIYNIVKYFQLCMDNNPNMIDSLFTDQNCILHITSVGNMVRENRHMFLHKGSWHKFKGYAYSQLHKMSSKNPTGKRLELREKFGFDVKFGYHVVRLLSEVEQILLEGDLDLREKGRREHMKAVRRGEVSEQDIRDWASAKEHQLEKAYSESKLQHSPDEGKIKQLLLDCLEHHYGSIEKCVVNPDKAVQMLKDIRDVIDKGDDIL
jgi:predicted nucleotidyltransferase